MSSLRTKKWKQRRILDKDNLIDKAFGKLKVLSFECSRQFKHYKHRMWRCLCECGKITVVAACNLKSGRTISCGCESGRNSLPDYKHAKNATYNDYLQGAKRRRINFELSKEDLINMIMQDCHYCGAKPANVKRTKYTTMVKNGIDRKNNDIGYTLDNCVPCCKICNYAKHSLSYDDFIKYLDRLVTFRTNMKSSEK